MRYTVLFSILLIAILTGCKKSKFQSTPSLKVKSVSTSVLPPNQNIQFILSFTDAEGDLNDSLYIEEKALNCQASSFTDHYTIPPFPTTKNEQGDIVVDFRYIDITPRCQENDTAIFRFAIKDKANHVSDTVSTSPIIIISQ
ncbi:MAG: hypothetical protein ACTHNG_00645 [Ginsengibacter sp.]|jgi:hypothetical protein